jgi:hypothetical protein
MATLLSGCGSPITNHVLVEDFEFLDALPSRSRHAGPTAVMNAPLKDALLLQEAQQAGDNLNQLTEAIFTVSDVLLATVPDERNTTLRSWEPVSVVDERDDEVFLFWVQAELLRTDDSQDIVWTIQAAADTDGPFVDVGTGRHDPSGAGSFRWDISAHAVLIGEQAEGTLEVKYEVDEDGARISEYRVEEQFFGTDQLWVTHGQAALAFTSVLELTEDGLEWPGWVQTVHVPEKGGRALGALYKSENDVFNFASCWSADGVSQWVHGDVDIATHGTETNCTLDDILSE